MIDLIKFESSDVLRQKRFEESLEERKQYDDMMFRRVMIVIGTAISAEIGFIVGQVVATSILM